MGLSEISTTIVEGLKLFGVTKECVLCIVFVLKTEEQELAMLDWIIEQIDDEKIPTENKCLEQAVMITQKYDKYELKP